MEKTHEIVGNLHIHTLHSDGAWDLPRIARCAARFGLDFIITHDHAHMSETLHLEEEGYYGGLLALVGLEIGREDHHYLAFDLREKISGEGLSPQAVIDAVRRQGGFGMLAHPFEKGMLFSEHSKAYTWNDLSVEGYDGICIWNFSSRWKERVKSPWHGLWWLVFKTAALKGPSRRALAFWDEACRERCMVGVAGSDAHGTRFQWGRIHLRPFSYPFLLQTLTVHLLLDEPLASDFARAKAQVYSALKGGRVFMAHEHLAPARGFRWAYRRRNGAWLRMGREASYGPGELWLHLPRPGMVRLIRDGDLLETRPCRRWASWPIQRPGVYRVEIAHRHPLFGFKPWIYSNPVYLR